MEVSGKREDLLAFNEKAGRGHDTGFVEDSQTWNEETKSWDKIPEGERVIKHDTDKPTAISFWNFIRPSDDELPYYFGQKDSPKTGGELYASSDWYGWNINHWDTKWDANDDYISYGNPEELKDTDSLGYQFQTARSIPEKVFVAMVEQHPELSFTFGCEEEQGWGAEFSGKDGKLTLDKEWDIPQSHADWVALGREDSCVCGWADDDTFSDCPNARKDYRVVVQYAYNVSAQDEDTARQIVERGLTPAVFTSPDADMAHFADESISVVLIDNGEDEIDLTE
jgi:hypothetical protein